MLRQILEKFKNNIIKNFSLYAEGGQVTKTDTEAATENYNDGGSGDGVDDGNVPSLLPPPWEHRATLSRGQAKLQVKTSTLIQETVM